MLNPEPLLQRLTPLLPVAMLFASTAHAQPLFTPGAGVVSQPGFVGPGPNRDGNPGPGVGWSYYGVPSGPTTAFSDMLTGRYHWGWSGYPNHAAGVWSRVLGVYGSPIPNYVPMPGIGGCDDRKCFMTPPTIGFGLHALGYRSAYVRLATPSVTVRPQAAATPAASTCAQLEVCLPTASAEVWVNGERTNATGEVRSFESPELAEGKSYGYMVTAKWTTNGEAKTESRNVTVTAGNTVRVDFNK